AAVARRETGDAVAPAADRNDEIVLAGEADRRDDVLDTGAPRDERGMAVGHRVPTTRLESYSRLPGWINSPRKLFRSVSGEAASRVWVTIVFSPLAPHPWKLYREDRRKRTGDDLSTGLAEHETDCCDELAVPARDRLSTLHELISIERERLRLDLVPAVREQDVLDLVELNTKSHLAPPWCPTLSARAQASAVCARTGCKEGGLHKKR